jgi:hypothetical protein
MAKTNITRFNYWESWQLVKKNPGVPDDIDIDTLFLKSEGYDDETTKLANKMLKEVNKNIRSPLSPEMISLKKEIILHPDFNQVIYHLSKSAKKNKEDAKLLDDIFKAIKGDRRGSTSIKKLKTIIKQDIDDFKTMVKKRLEGETIEKITEGYDTTLIKIWSAYIKLSRLIMKEYKLSEKNKDDWKFIFKILKAMSNNLTNTKSHSLIIKHKKSSWKLANATFL